MLFRGVLGISRYKSRTVRIAPSVAATSQNGHLSHGGDRRTELGAMRLVQAITDLADGAVLPGSLSCSETDSPRWANEPFLIPSVVLRS